MTNRFVKSSILFHIICNPMFNKLYDFIFLCFTLYNFCLFSIFFIFYNHLFIDVYAHNSWCVRLSRLKGRVTGDRHASLSRFQRSTEKPLPDLTLSLSKAPHPLPATPDPLLGKGSIKKEQPPDGSCSLIPKGFHYIYFIPYI